MLWALFLVSILSVAASSSTLSDYLTTDSVVLITGAAGFIGSELAMALHRTFKPKKIICVDSMKTMTKGLSLEERLSLFEFKRQRAFHVLQTLGNKGHFYRADFRPSIPEYFDMGEVPILDYIFRDHPNITHVVHLADAYHRGAGDDMIQAVPREKDDIKAGMIESLLEQLMKAKDETGRAPHFTYASSYEVYDYLSPTTNNPNPPPFREEKPISTPSSLRGATKLIDEILARTYSENYGIYSVGLRFFPVYGPWGLPGTPLFEMAERAVSNPSNPLMTHAERDMLDDIRDYVYIDDAVDAIMTAMQFRPLDNGPVVVNVGTGEGKSIRDAAHLMEEAMPRLGVDSSKVARGDAKTVAVASTDRSKQILGFDPQVSFREGIVRLLAWHHDRIFTLGTRAEGKTSIADKGIASCSPHDKECLHGAPVFPCASECSHESQCFTSFYDDVLIFSRSVTADCLNVMYTVAIEEDLVSLPSAGLSALPETDSYIKEENCNIAFVSESSPLVRRLKREAGYPMLSTVVEEVQRRVAGSSGQKKSNILTNGFWTLIPLPVPSFGTGDESILRMLPKLSPGMFFGPKTKHAIYCDPDVLFTNVPSLLEEAQMQPFLEGVQGATAMLVARDRPKKKKKQVSSSRPNDTVQRSAYRSIRIGIIDDMEPNPVLDSSWMVHRLQNEDSRNLRCDVFGEVVQWDVDTDEEALGFIVGLHDMWTRVVIQEQDVTPWWTTENVVTVRERPELQGRRRLDEAVEKEKEVGEAAKTEDKERDEGGTDGENEGEGEAGEAEDKDATENSEREVEQAGAGSKDNGEQGGDEARTKEAGEGEQDGLVKDGKATENGEGKVEEGGRTGEGQAEEERDHDTNGKADGEEGGKDEQRGKVKVVMVDKKRDGDGHANKQALNPILTDKEASKAQVLHPMKASHEVPVHMIDEERVSPDEKPKQSGGAFVASNDEANELSEADQDVVLQPKKQATEAEEEDDRVDDEIPEDAEAKKGVKRESAPERDVSSYDTWMGVLSSPSAHFFVRIVPSSEVGVLYLDDYDITDS